MAHEGTITNFPLIWFVAYALPAFAVLIILQALPQYKPGTVVRGAIAGAGLFASTMMSQGIIYAAGLSFPWFLSGLSLILFFISVSISFIVLGSFGIVYALAVLLQQVTLLSISFIIFPSLPPYAIILLVVPLFAFAHMLQMKHWQMKVAITFLWGACSIFLFSILMDVFIIAALHTLFGVLFIGKMIMYPSAEFKIKRLNV